LAARTLSLNINKKTFFVILYFSAQFCRQSAGENDPRSTLARVGLDLLDAWSDGNATPRDRRSPLGEVLAVTLADTRSFL
jgi:hypothetical protein